MLISVQKPFSQSQELNMQYTGNKPCETHKSGLSSCLDYWQIANNILYNAH